MEPNVELKLSFFNHLSELRSDVKADALEAVEWEMLDHLLQPDVLCGEQMNKTAAELLIHICELG